MRLRTRWICQRGYTLTELIIATSLSLTVIGTVLACYLATYTSSMNTLAASKLSQDMSVLLDIMANELRRAGYAGLAPPTLVSNPFALPTSTALAVFDDMNSNMRQPGTGSGSCIVYAYDRDEDGVVDTEELAGFRLTDAGVVEMRTAGNMAAPDSCTSRFNSWADLTDPDFVTISTLTFDLAHSRCLNTHEIASATAADCYAHVPSDGSGDTLVETRAVTIMLAAHLAGDPFVRLAQTRNVLVRNDVMSVR